MSWGSTKNSTNRYINCREAKNNALRLRVMLMEPRVWLLDEPSSALDKDTEDLVMQKVVDFGRRNESSIVFVTHSSPMAWKYAEEMIEIENGEIVSIKQNQHA